LTIAVAPDKPLHGPTVPKDGGFRFRVNRFADAVCPVSLNASTLSNLGRLDKGLAKEARPALV
jgi:hypothetical protein